MELLGLRINHMALCSFLCLAMGAVAFNGKEAYPKDPTDEKSDFSCDEKGYLEYLSKWGDAKGTSRDVKSEEFKKRLEYFKQSCKTIHGGSGKRSTRIGLLRSLRRSRRVWCDTREFSQRRR